MLAITKLAKYRCGQCFMKSLNSFALDSFHKYRSIQYSTFSAYISIMISVKFN